MSDVVIRAEGLGKKYLIGHQADGAPYLTLRESMIRAMSRFGRNALDMARGRALIMGDNIEEYWALKDVDFEIQRGEVVGIVGRNGAGKSTLLKVLSRITEPSEGRVTLEGRVASLLEVGTGFHPELSGRENIFLNGAILGMTRSEIQAKFDEIVDFAGVEKFIDTPVKRYSSGMQVRLGFAVAAHLEPEILIVDEVLAVGDVEFQKKCMGRMQDVAGSGRTVLFVSHNMGAVQALCESAILLEQGQVLTTGPTSSTLAAYSSSIVRKNSTTKLAGDLFVDSVDVRPSPPHSRKDVEIQIKLVGDTTSVKELAVLLYTSGGERAAIIDARPLKVLPMSVPRDGLVLNVRVKAIPLVEGDYSIGLYVKGEEFSGNFLDLGVLTLLAAELQNGILPYSALQRGVVELDAVMTIGSPNPKDLA